MMERANMKRLCFLLLIAMTLLPGCAKPLAAGEQSVALGAHGVLALQLPAGWVMEESRPAAALPPTLRFGPEVGDEFVVLVTPIWPEAGAEPGFGSPESVYRIVAAAALEVAPEAAEPQLEIHAFDDGRVGYFFWATDRKLQDMGRIPPGEYLYLTQGGIMVGDLFCTFTILTNERPSGVIDSALMMLRGAAHRIGS